jgi:transcriptional regulator with XRE-family HTH domain
MKKRHLADLMRQIRLEAKLTQSEVAEKLGQSQSYVSKYESGEQRLDLTELEAFCTAVRLPLLTFIGRYLES